jgi:hypothetical protein
MDRETILIGNDHGGYDLALRVADSLKERGLAFEHVGSYSGEIVRYPYYAAKVASAISRGEIARGVLICSTGIGMSIIANRFAGVRAADHRVPGGPRHPGRLAGHPLRGGPPRHLAGAHRRGREGALQPGRVGAGRAHALGARPYTPNARFIGMPRAASPAITAKDLIPFTLTTPGSAPAEAQTRFPSSNTSSSSSIFRTSPIRR